MRRTRSQRRRAFGDTLYCSTASSPIKTIKSLAEQMMPGFPNLYDAFYEGWHAMMEKYGDDWHERPVCRPQSLMWSRSR